MTPLLLLAASLAAPPAPAQAVAFVLEVNGDVSVERDGKPSPLDDGDPLRPGDKIKVPAGGGLKVYFRPAGPVASLQGPADASVEAGKLASDTAVAVRDAGLPGQSAERLSRELADGKMGGVVLRAGTPAAAVRPIDGSAVIAAKPLFRWPAAAGAAGYKITLFLGPDGPTQRVYWTARTAEPTAVYPDDARPLRRGPEHQYRWVATAEVGGAEKVAGGGYFTAMDPAAFDGDKLAKLAASADASDWLLAAEAYAASGMVEEATAQYERVAAKRPASAGAWRALARLYGRAGETAKAKEAEEKVAKLTAGR